MSIIASGNFAFQQNRNSATQVVASGGRTLTFSGAAHTVTASSGSFVTDGFVAGGLLTVAGTSSNDGVYTISIVTALVITVSAGMAADGPLSATATLDGTSNKAFVFGSEAQNGRFGHYMEASFSGTDGSLTLLWDTGPGLPTGFTAWGSGGLWLDAKLDARAWGSLEILLTLSVLDPADGTTLVSATRAVTAVDADYARLTIPKATLDAAALAAGDEVRVQFDVALTVAAGSAYPWIRIGELGADFGSGGGGGGGGGGGSGDVTEVQGTSPIVVTSGTGPIPVVTLPGAALTKVDDTNVTLTLGGTPTTALARAASITAGWTGQLAVARGGTGVATVADHLALLGPTSGGPSAPTWRALDATDVPALPYVPTTRNVNTTTPLAGGGALSGDLTLNLGTPAALTVLKGTGTNPAFSTLADADLASTTAVLQATLDATALTLGLGLNMLYSEVHEKTSGPQTTSWDLPADTLYDGGMGVEIFAAGVAQTGGTDVLSVTFNGAELMLDPAAVAISYPASSHVSARIRVMTPSGAPGSAVAWMEVTMSDATAPVTNIRCKPTYIAFDTTVDNTIAVGWAHSSGHVQAFQVALLAGIPSNPIVSDGGTPRTPQPVTASGPNALIVQQRSGTAPGLYRMSGLTSVGSIVGTNTFGGNETGTQTALWYARFNDVVKFKGKYYAVSTTGTSAHKVYERTVGGATNTTAVATETYTTGSLMRTGLHVVSNGTDSRLVLVYVDTLNQTLRMLTFDGSTWVSYALATSLTNPVEVCAFGVAINRGLLYVSSYHATNALHGLFMVNPFAGTGSSITVPSGTSASCAGMCLALAGRVFWMSGAIGSSVQRQVYEIVAGAFVSRLTLTSGGTDTVTANAVAACMFPIGDLEFIALYPTNTGGTAANAFWSASKVTIDPDTGALSETTLGSLLDSSLTAAGSVNGQTSSKNVFACVDNETDPGAPAVYLFQGGNSLGAVYAVAQYLGESTALSWTNTGANNRDHAIPAGDFGGGQRFSPDDTADLAWVTTTIVPSTTTSRVMDAAFRFTAQGSDTWTVKVFVSTFEGVVLGQATLTGTAGGGSATRVGNEVQGCDLDTDHTVSVDFGAMGLYDLEQLKLTFRASREV